MALTPGKRDRTGELNHIESIGHDQCLQRQRTSDAVLTISGGYEVAVASELAIAELPIAVLNPQ